MRRLLVMAMVIGAGAIGFAAASQAGNPLRFARAGDRTMEAQSVAQSYAGSGCRIEKSLRYDFHGNPYMKKVRVCA